MTSLAATAVLSACGANAPLVVEELDPQTAVTVTRPAAPIVLYRDDSARAAHARTFVYLGPVRVNRMGQYSHFLWLGIWSTMSDPDPVAGRDAFDSITVYADGEPLGLDVSGWTPGSIGLSQSTYPSPAAGATSAYYAVTLDQVRLIAEALHIRIHTGGGEAESFEPWDRNRQARDALDAFLDFVAY